MTHLDSAEEKPSIGGRVTIRLAEEKDRLAIFKLAVYMHRETDFAHYAFDPIKSINSLGEWIHGAPKRYMIIAERDQHIVGMLFMVIDEVWFSQETVAVEELFYVHPAHRGCRAAYLLMKEFFDVAKQCGAKHIKAGVATGSGPAAERLYKRFGMQYMGGNFSAHFEE